MPTEALPTRRETPPESLPHSFALALGLHAALVAILFATTALRHHPDWGDRNPSAGSIQATMVNSLPLPPRQPTPDKSVLATDKPSIAPTPAPSTPKAAPAKPKAAPLPRPNEVLIPNKTQPKPTPQSIEHEQPSPLKRPPAQPARPTPKATTGETAGLQIPQSITQLKNGTASITVEERSFGDRFAYYIRGISQKVNQAWIREEADAHSSDGRRTTVTFTIDRDGAPTEPHVSARSGSPSLDSSALRAIQRIDTFGPLPQGDRITIQFSFDFRAQ